MNASEKFPVLLDVARRALHPMASRDHSGDGAPDPPRRPPLPSPPPPSPSPPSPDRTPEPMRDPPHPEHPDPVREPLWPEPVRDPPHPEHPDPVQEPPWPEPVRDPHRPEHPDPVREPPSDRPPGAVTSALIEARHLPRLFAFPSPHLPLSTLRPHPYECVRMTRGRRSWLSFNV